MIDNSVTILLVDDDDVDVRLVQRALKKQNITNPMIVARDGVEALAVLKGSDDRQALQQPYLILLDLKMPRMNGLELLDHIRNDESLAQSIVFVLTTSNAERDRQGAYQKNVAGYLLKAKAGQDLENHMPLIERFLDNVEFPTSSN